jgi:LuxR family transcriptional regulator, maltose regulon positive regulatory protein
MKACVQIAAGDLTFAAWWVHDRGFSVDDDADYLREYEHLTPPRLLLAQHHAEQSRDHAGAAAPAVGVLGLLDRLHAAATDAGRDRSVLEIRVLQALTHQADGDQPAALAAPWVGRPSRRAICACTWTKAPG